MDTFNENIYDHCPKCNGETIKKGKERWNGKGFSQRLECKNCGYKWEFSVKDRSKQKEEGIIVITDEENAFLLKEKYKNV